MQILSRDQHVGDIARAIAARTPITTLPPDNVLTALVEAIALKFFAAQVEVARIPESLDLDKQTGSQLDITAQARGLPDGRGGAGRQSARASTGYVTVSAPYTKNQTILYGSLPPPAIGSRIIRVTDASSFPSEGSVFLGRNTDDRFEGPVVYKATVNRGLYWELVLTGPLTKNHLHSDEVVLSQGSDISIPTGSKFITTSNILFSALENKTLFAGEDSVDIRVQCDEVGEVGNIGRFGVVGFVSAPSVGVQATNKLAFSDGREIENDADLRARIKEYYSTVAKGTVTSLISAARLPSVISVNALTSTTSDGNIRTTIIVDDGSDLSYASVQSEVLTAKALGGETSFFLYNKPLLPPSVIGTIDGPFNLSSGGSLQLIVDDTPYVFGITAADVTDLRSVTALDIARTFNRITSDVAWYVIGDRLAALGRTDNESIVVDGDLADVFGFRDSRSVFLYRNGQLISHVGREATIITQSSDAWLGVQGELSADITVDGVTIPVEIKNEHFIQRFNTLAINASIDQWAAVLEQRIVGVRCSVVGNTIHISSARGRSSDASIGISGSAWVGSVRLFSKDSAAQGVSKDFILHRTIGSIELIEPMVAGETLSVIAGFVPAMTFSEVSSQVVVPENGTPRIICCVGDATIRALSWPVGEFTINVSKLGSLVTLSHAGFSGARIGDWLWLQRETVVTTPIPSGMEGLWKIVGITSESVTIDAYGFESFFDTFLIKSSAIGVFSSDVTPDIITLPTGVLWMSDIPSLISPKLRYGSLEKISANRIAIVSDSSTEPVKVVFASVGLKTLFGNPSDPTGVVAQVVSSKILNGVHSCGSSDGNSIRMTPAGATVFLDELTPFHNDAACGEFVDQGRPTSPNLLTIAGRLSGVWTNAVSSDVSEPYIGNRFAPSNAVALSHIENISQNDYDTYKYATLRATLPAFTTYDALSVVVGGQSAVLPMALPMTIAEAHAGNISRLALIGPDGTGIWDSLSPLNGFDFSKFVIKMRPIGFANTSPSSVIFFQSWTFDDLRPMRLQLRHSASTDLSVIHESIVIGSRPETLVTVFLGAGPELNNINSGMYKTAINAPGALSLSTFTPGTKSEVVFGSLTFRAKAIGNTTVSVVISDTGGAGPAIATITPLLITIDLKGVTPTVAEVNTLLDTATVELIGADNLTTNPIHPSWNGTSNVLIVSGGTDDSIGSLDSSFVVGDIIEFSSNHPYKGVWAIVNNDGNGTILLRVPPVDVVISGEYSAAEFPLSHRTPKETTLSELYDILSEYCSNLQLATFEYSGSAATIVDTPFWYNSLETSESIDEFFFHSAYKHVTSGLGFVIHRQFGISQNTEYLEVVSLSEKPLLLEHPLYSFVGETVNVAPSNAETMEKWCNTTTISPISVVARVKENPSGSLTITSKNSGSQSAMTVIPSTANKMAGIAIFGADRIGEYVRLQIPLSLSRYICKSAVQITNSAVSKKAKPLAESSAMFRSTVSVVVESAGLNLTRLSIKPIVASYAGACSGRQSGNKVSLQFSEGVLDIQVGDMLYVAKGELLPKLPCTAPSFNQNVLPEYPGYIVSDVQWDETSNSQFVEIVVPRAVFLNFATTQSFTLAAGDLLVYCIPYWRKNIAISGKHWLSTQVGQESILMFTSGMRASDNCDIDQIGVTTDDIVYLSPHFVGSAKIFTLLQCNSNDMGLWSETDRLLHSPIPQPLGAATVTVLSPDSVVMGDSIVIDSAQGSNWFPQSLYGQHTVTSVGWLMRSGELQFAVTFDGVCAASSTFSLGVSSEKVYIQSQLPRSFLKMPQSIIPASADYAHIWCQSSFGATLIDGATLRVLGKLELPEVSEYSSDGYRYFTGAVAEAQRRISGDIRDIVVFPGVEAAGTLNEVMIPLPLNVELTILLVVAPGHLVSQVQSRVRVAIMAHSGRLPVGKNVSLSEVVTVAQFVVGVSAVTITATVPVAVDGVIRLTGAEKVIIKESDINFV